MTSQLNIQVMPGTHRHDVVTLLDGSQNVGIELGVAEGIFSERMLASGRFAQFFGVDMYADTHDVRQYKRALVRLGLQSNYKLLRMRFDEAFDLFEDESFDFVYVDGYAHGGEEGGTTIFEWFKKVKIGGIIAGDDYSPAWPLVVRAVHEFALQVGQPVFVTEITETDNAYCKYPTWAIKKVASLDIAPPKDLVKQGQKANARVARAQEGSAPKRFLKAVLPRSTLAYLKRVRNSLR